MAREVHEPAGYFSERLARALAEEKKSPTRTEREAGLKRGYMSQVKHGKIRTPNPETIRQLSDYLRVSYEWLAIGRGPMRPTGWAPSPLEEATLFALRNGAREDAIAAAADRYRDAQDMTAVDWVMAFDNEARRLDRVGTPRPEVVEKRQAQIRRAASKKRRGEEPPPPPPAAQALRPPVRRSS